MAVPWLYSWIVSASVWSLGYYLWCGIAVLDFINTVVCEGDVSFFWDWDYQHVLHMIGVFIVCCWRLLWSYRSTILPVVCCDLLIIWVWFQSQDCVHFDVHFEFWFRRHAVCRIMFLLLFWCLLTTVDCCFGTYIHDVLPNVLCATSLAR